MGAGCWVLIGAGHWVVGVGCGGCGGPGLHQLTIGGPQSVLVPVIG